MCLQMTRNAPAPAHRLESAFRGKKDLSFIIKPCLPSREDGGIIRRSEGLDVKLLNSISTDRYPCITGISNVQWLKAYVCIFSIISHLMTDSFFFFTHNESTWIMSCSFIFSNFSIFLNIYCNACAKAEHWFYICYI